MARRHEAGMLFPTEPEAMDVPDSPNEAPMSADCVLRSGSMRGRSAAASVSVCSVLRSAPWSGANTRTKTSSA